MIKTKMENVIKFIFSLVLLIVAATLIAAVWKDPGLHFSVRFAVTCGMGAIIGYILYLYWRFYKNYTRNDK